MTTPLLLLCLLAPPEQEPDELLALQAVLARALERIAPSVVTVTTVGGIRNVEIPEDAKSKMTVPERPRDGQEPGEGEEGPGEPEGSTPRFPNEWMKMLAAQGFKKAEGPTTGLVISADGHIVTSAWNFDSKPQVVVVTTAAGGTHAARLLGIDRASGLALLKIDAAGLPVPTFLDPKDVDVGAWAFAVGRALTKDAVDVKYGIISAKNRVEGNALQTDAASSPTNYGGPLVDLEGRVYGVLVPLGARGEEVNPNWYDSGIGFATPIPDPARLIARLGKEGTVLEPAFLGVQMDEERTEEGARVVDVVADQPAAKAGVAKDDVVLAIDGQKVRNSFALRFEIGRRRAGDTVKLTVKRGNETKDIEATLGPRPKDVGSDERLPVPLPGPGEERK